MVAPNTDAGGIVIKPNKAPMVYKRIGAMFRIANNMGANRTYGGNTITNNTNTNTMNFNSYNSTQMKNDEWGAVAYLSNSAYGTTGAGNAIVYSNGYYNSNVSSSGTCTVINVTTDTSTTATGCLFVTGAGPVADQSDRYNATLYQYHTTIGQQASTTGNIYGIYDIAGGVSEYIMGNLNSTGSIYIGTIPNADYYNNYPGSGTRGGANGSGLFCTATDNSSTGCDSKYVYFGNNQKCNWATCGGHALHETKRVQSVSSLDQSWGWDSSRFVYSDYPWFMRGGSSVDGSYAGVFASSNSAGGAGAVASFRVVAGSF
jgi:hypothetical protein